MDTSRLSVVIPTLGNDCLRETLANLNRGSVKPDEVLICIPQDYAHRVEQLPFDNIRIVTTERAGQVSQRATGFAVARSEYVLQLDDDMLVEHRCVEKLLAACSAASSKTAVAPSFVNKSDGQPFYRAPSCRPALWLYYFLINGTRGYVPGSVTRAGTCVGFDPSVSTQATNVVEWLPGGCVLHRRENLVLDHFYPFSGKAFCEDLIHSHHLKKKGVALCVVSEARCIVDDASFLDTPVKDFIRFMRGDARARRYLVRLAGLSLIRMYVFYVILTARYLFRRLARPFKSGGTSVIAKTAEAAVADRVAINESDGRP